MSAVASSPIPAVLRPLDADRIADLGPYLESVPDPRSRRGRWYSLTALLLMCACAAVCGAKSIDELAEFGERATNSLLASLGAGRHLLGWRRSPKPVTLGRVLQALDGDRPPQVLLLTVDLDEDLVQVPLVPGAGPTAAQRVGVVLPELGAPPPDGFRKTATPRSSISSSTSRKLSGNRKYSHTQCEMASTGYRYPLYDGGVPTTDDSPQPDQPEDHPTGQPT